MPAQWVRHPRRAARYHRAWREHALGGRVVRTWWRRRALLEVARQPVADFAGPYFGSSAPLRAVRALAPQELRALADDEVSDAPPELTAAGALLFEVDLSRHHGGAAMVIGPWGGLPTLHFSNALHSSGNVVVLLAAYRSYPGVPLADASMSTTGDAPTSALGRRARTAATAASPHWGASVAGQPTALAQVAPAPHVVFVPGPQVPVPATALHQQPVRIKPVHVSGLTTGQHIVHGTLTVITGGLWGVVWWWKATMGRRRVG